MDSSLSLSDDGNNAGEEVVAHSGDADASDLGKEESLTASKSSPDPAADADSLVERDNDDDDGERDRPNPPPLPEMPPSPVDEVGYRVIANQAAAG